MMPAPGGSSVDTHPPPPLFSPRELASHLMRGSKLVTSRLNTSGLFFFLIYFIEAQLIYNAVFISAVQQSDSVIHI